MSKKILSKRYPSATIKKGYFQPYDYLVLYNGTTYHIKKLPVSKHTILSINSSIIWEIRKGRQKGNQFKTTKTMRFHMGAFNKFENKIILFHEQPFKILRYLNESEVEDISTIHEIQSIQIYRDVNEVILK